MRKMLLIVGILFLSASTGCVAIGRHRSQERRVAQLKETIDPLIGKSEDEVLAALGAPLRIDEAGSFRIFRYRESHGYRGDALFGSGRVGGATQWEVFDSYDLFFKDGRMVEWKSQVQR